MSETPTLQSAIAHLLKPGSYPRAGGSASNLVMQERTHVTQLQAIARKGQGAALAGRLSGLCAAGKALAPLEGAEAGGIAVYATGPHDYWIFSETHGAEALQRRLADELGETASLFDQSHARFVIRISGDNATGVLAKGSPLDLDAGPFRGQGASHTTIAHIPVLVARRGAPPCHDLSVPLGYAVSFMAWLLEAARESGYTVEASERVEQR